MREGMTNIGKKEQRQFNQRLTKAYQEDQTHDGKDIEARTAPKQHRLKGRKHS